MWKALFVEPVPYLFEKLKANYPKNPRFRFENVAVNDGKIQDFYWVDPNAKFIVGNLPEWFDQLGSFDRSHINKHLNGTLELFIISTKIKGITLNELFRKCEINHIDLLRIDCEGYDWKILKQLKLDRLKPSLILVEIKHLCEEDLGVTLKFLSKHYRIFWFDGDILCIIPEVYQNLAAKHRRYLQSKHAL